MALLNEVINGQVSQRTFTETFASSGLTPAVCCANHQDGVDDGGDTGRCEDVKP